MPHYFFHVRDSGGLTEDPEGTECADEAQARAEAIAGARDLMAEHVRMGLDVSNWCYEIVDDHGHRVMTVPFIEAIRR